MELVQLSVRPQTIPVRARQHASVLDCDETQRYSAHHQLLKKKYHQPPGRRLCLAQQTKYALLKGHYLAGKIFRSSEIKNRICLAQWQACGREYVRLAPPPRKGICIPASVRALGGYPSAASGLPK